MNAASVIDYKPLSSGSLRGVMTIALPSGMVLHSCPILETDGRAWVAPPSKVRVYGTEVKTGADGRPIYDPVVSFADRATADLFSAAALAALDEYLAGDEASCYG